MGFGIKGVALAATGFMFMVQGAYAWYGPICYSDRTTQLVLTIPSISGETPGDLKVDFDDNDGKVRLGTVRASTAVKNAHEVVLSRDAESHNGIFAVLVTSPRSTTGYKFELEFRKDASECAGAIIKATDRPFGGAPAAGVALASAPAKPRVRAPKPKLALASAPVLENGVQVVNLDANVKAEAAPSSGVSEVELKPLPTPSAGSEAPAVNEPVQQAGEAPKVDAPVEAQTEAPKSEPVAQPHELGSEAPAATQSE